MRIVLIKYLISLSVSLALFLMYKITKISLLIYLWLSRCNEVVHLWNYRNEINVILSLSLSLSLYLQIFPSCCFSFHFSSLPEDHDQQLFQQSRFLQK